MERRYSLKGRIIRVCFLYSLQVNSVIMQYTSLQVFFNHPFQIIIDDHPTLYNPRHKHSH